MKWWPFGGQKKAEKMISDGMEPSAMERLLSRDCSKDEFVLLYFKCLEERLPENKLEMSGETVIRRVDPEGKESTIYLDNTWIAYSRGGEEERRDLLERHLRVMASMGEPNPPVVREQIVGMIKDTEYTQMFKPEFGAMIEHLCGDLWVVYAQDLPDKMLTLKKTSLAEAGIEEAGIRNIAVENLQRMLPSAQRHGEGPWYLLTAGGDYTASLLLFDGMWDDLVDDVEGEIVAVVPARDVLMYTGSKSPEGLAALRERASQIVTTGNYVISDTLIVRSGGRWEVFNAN